MIPQHLGSIFWDVNPTGFDPAFHPQFCISRVLEFGDQTAVAWLWNSFSREAIEQVVRSERRLTRRSANFWALVYGIPKDQVAALQKPHGSLILRTVENVG